MRRFIAAALAAVCLAGSAGATIKPNRSMRGVALGMTPAQVQAKLGRPIGRSVGRWYYPLVWVGFRGRRVVELTTTRPTERLPSGVGVDSTEAQLRAAHPRATCAAMPPFRRCRLGTGAPNTRVTDFTIGRTGRIIQISVLQLP